MDSNAPLTAYADVNAALQTIADSIRGVLGGRFVGFYVYGSLAAGDFDPESSDIDALVVTTDSLDSAIFEKLKKLHDDLFEVGSKWVRETELFYIPQAEMRKYDRAHAPRIRLHEGRVIDSFWQGDDWILHRHVLREQGIVVAGPHPKTMIDPVTPENIHQAVKVGIMQNWWQDKVLAQPARLKQDRHQAHAILTMCRALYTLQTGKLASKKAAASWAHERLDEPFKSLVARAAAWKHGTVMQDYDGAIDFIRYAVGKAKAGDFL